MADVARSMSTKLHGTSRLARRDRARRKAMRSATTASGRDRAALIPGKEWSRRATERHPSNRRVCRYELESCRRVLDAAVEVPPGRRNPALNSGTFHGMTLTLNINPSVAIEVTKDCELSEQRLAADVDKLLVAIRVTKEIARPQCGRLRT